uniref:Protein kinase domain-containing protein n=1 Tax=Mola mola TaxID=94237 RepID=A0A3Q3VZZ0_MOLML
MDDFFKHDGSLIINQGSLLGTDHEVREILGLGSFSLVFKCCNVKTGKMEAMKVYNSYNSYNRYNSIIYQGIQEIEMLRRLHCLDPDTCNIVKWTDFFYDKEKLCICFELLDQTLRDYMVDRECRSLPIPEVRSIIHQVTTALSHLNSIGIVHADLKPDNVMVVDRHQQPLKVKLINFGQAQLVSAINPDVPIQTLSYRAPEVMLGIPFNEAIDVWSLGLTATELVTGCPLYMGNDEYDVLRAIIQTQGQPADDQRWKFKTPEEFELDVRYHSVKELLTLDDLQELMEMDRGHQSGQHLLVDLIKRMLHLNPDERIKPAEVLQHPFFSLSVPPSSPAHVYIEVEPEIETPEVSQQPISFQREQGEDDSHPKTLACPTPSPSFLAKARSSAVLPTSFASLNSSVWDSWELQPPIKFRS